MRGRHRFDPLGRHRNIIGRPFWWLWSGQTLSSLGSAAQSLALPLWILQVTGSTAVTGAALALQLAPRVLFSPFAGVLADRLDRRTLSITINLIAGALTLALLPVLGAGNIHLYFVFSVLLGTLATLNSAVLPALTPSLVRASRLTSANAAQEASGGAILALGPLAGATVAVAIGFTGAVAVNAASFILAALLTVPVPAQPPAARRTHRPIGMLREGLHALVGNRLLRTAVLAEAALFLFLGAVPQFAVILIGQGGRTADAGLFSSGVGAGWLVTSMVVGRRRQEVDPTVMLLIGAATAAPVIGVVVLSAHAAVYWIFLGGVLAGAHNLLFAMAPGLLVQRRAAREALGRVIAFRRSFVVLAQAAALVLATLVSPKVGVGAFLLASAVAGSAAATPIALRAVRRARAEAPAPAPAPAPA